VNSNGDLVEVRLFGPLREAVGEKSVSVPYAGMTVAEALAQFADEQGAAVRPMLFDSRGHRLRSLILLLNDQTVDDSDTNRLHGGDVITVLLPLAGG
jgi:molybdopterin converting factor small subunit